MRELAEWAYNLCAFLFFSCGSLVLAVTIVALVKGLRELWRE